jgi:hypothetical protein
MAVINQEYIDSMVITMENIPKCPDFGGLANKTPERAQEIIDDIMGSLAAVGQQVQAFIDDMFSAITDQIAALEVLITPPTDLGEIKDYLEALADTFAKPYDALVLSQVELAVSSVKLATAFSSAVSDAKACISSAGLTPPSLGDINLPV